MYDLVQTQVKDEIVPALMKEFGYSPLNAGPKLQKIVINQGSRTGHSDKKLLEFGVKELSDIAGQEKLFRQCQRKIYQTLN